MKLIDLQNAINIVMFECGEWTGLAREISKQLRQLPSVQSERKKGRWINRSLNILYPEWERYTCSVCGKYSSNYDFCPHCGADMRIEEADYDYERAVEQLEHDMLYEPTFNQDDGSM